MERVLDLAVQRIADAPFAADGWVQALAEFASAAGSWCGQLTGFSGQRRPLFTLGAVDRDLLAEWVARGGADPRRNPRANAAFAGAPLAVASDPDFIDADARRRHPMYRDFYDRVDAAFCLVTAVPIDDDFEIVASCLRSTRQGPPEAQHRAAFAALVPHLRASLRLQRAVEARTAQLLTNNLGTFHVPAFICSSAGRVIAASAPGEAIAAAGEHVRVRHGTLQATDAGSDRDLRDALANAFQPLTLTQPRQATVLLRSRRDGRPRRALVARCADAYGAVRPGSCAMVVVSADPHPDRCQILRDLGLTQAEAEVVIGLVDGRTAAAIARSRGIAVATVRAQLRSVHARLGVHNLAELMSFIATLL